MYDVSYWYIIQEWMNKKGVIFDFNGTLLWDTHLHNNSMKSAGIGLKLKVSGTTFRQLLK